MKIRLIILIKNNNKIILLIKIHSSNTKFNISREPMICFNTR